MTRLQSHRQASFTLLELLVAAMAAAVLMAALLLALGGAWRLQEQSHERETAALPRELARQLLASELAAAVPPAGVLAGPLTATRAEAGEWRRDEVEWVTATGARSPTNDGGDLVQVHYYLVDTDSSGVCRLVRTERRNLLQVETEEPTEETILAGVTSFAASWYDGTTWVESWDSAVEENQLPKAARLRLDFAASGRQTPPPLEMLVPLLMRTASAAGGTP